MRMSWIAVSVLWLATGGHASTDAAFTFPRSTPEAQGVSSAALLRFVDEAEQNVDALHSVMVVRHGQVVAEGWWKPYAADEPHMLFSLSKSFTSTAVGLAIADGKLKLDDPILQFFPDRRTDRSGRVAEGDAHSRSVDDVDRPSRRGHPRLPVLLERQPGEEVPAGLPVSHKPGTFFVYNTPATYMLSAIVQKVTGQTVLDYLRPRLFEPLGIEQSDVGGEQAGRRRWEASV